MSVVSFIAYSVSRSTARLPADLSLVLALKRIIFVGALFNVVAYPLGKSLNGAPVHVKVQRPRIPHNRDAMDVVRHHRNTDTGLDHDLFVEFESRFAGD